MNKLQRPGVLQANYSKRTIGRRKNNQRNYFKSVTHVTMLHEKCRTFRASFTLFTIRLEIHDKQLSWSALPTMTIEVPRGMTCKRARRPLRICVVYNNLPFPMMGGDQLTVAHPIGYLHARGHKVDFFGTGVGQ